WDSAHNKKLLSRIPKVYLAPDAKVQPGETNYLGFVGKGAFFEGKQGMRIPVDFTDGTSKTLMVVEAAEPVPWTKPVDLPFDPAKPPAKIGFRPDVFPAALCDGSARLISHKIRPATLRALITRNGNDVIGEDF